MKIAILHDYFDKMGGGERLVLNTARALNADVYTGFIDSGKTFDMKGIKVINLNVKGIGLHRKIHVSKKFGELKLGGYDAYLFSGVWCISAARNNNPSVLYLHTPMRAIYDLKQHFLEKSNPIMRLALREFSRYWTPKDKAFMNNFDLIGANSYNVKRRVLKYYGEKLYRRTRVVYTGIETEKYKYVKSGDFYLSSSRLDPLKRIDMIINAFKNMPSKKLIIAGAGPDEKRLKNLARGCSNIRFLGGVNDRTMLKLYSTCRATVAANIDEDLGLIAIESHASGKPIMAIKEGGFVETVNNSNGVFFTKESDIPRAIERLEKTKWSHKIIQASARKYDIKVFLRNIETLLREAIEKRYYSISQ